jgi:hypothetical protein
VAQAAGKMAAWKPHEGRWPKPQAGIQLKPPAGCRPTSPAGCRPTSPAGRWEATEHSCGARAGCARAGGDWTDELTMRASQRTVVAIEDDASDSSESRRACSRFMGQRILLRGSQVSPYPFGMWVETISTHFLEPHGYDFALFFGNCKQLPIFGTHVGTILFAENH